MKTQKHYQSQINLVKARLEQVKTSSFYKDEERQKLTTKLENQLNALAKDITVSDAETITS